MSRPDLLDALLAYMEPPEHIATFIAAHREECARAVMVKANPFEALQTLWLADGIGRRDAVLALMERVPEAASPLYTLAAK